MNDNFEESTITLTDEEGKETVFEVIGTFEVEQEQYIALIPTDTDEDECVLLKMTTDENGDGMLVTIDDDDEFERAAAAFEDEFMGECDLDDYDEEPEDVDADTEEDG